jgi:hypothetical protein
VNNLVKHDQASNTRTILAGDSTIKATWTPARMLLAWVFANAIGLGVGMAIFATVAEGIEQSGVLGNPELGDNVGHIIGLALAGVIFGLLQWAVLRRHFTSTGWGVLGTSIGLAIGYILGYIMGGPPFDFILAPALAMLLGGFAQWLALRRQTTGPDGGWR